MSTSGFGLANVPFGTALLDGRPTWVTRIGPDLYEIHRLAAAGKVPIPTVRSHSLGDALPLGRRVLSEVRNAIIELYRTKPDVLAEFARPAEGVRMLLPARPKAFVDFYSGIHHASNVGRMFRPDQPPLLPNYRHIPVGYNGRASSVFPTEQAIYRPSGQTRVGEQPPTFGPTKELDFELELGFYLAQETQPGEVIPVEEAEQAIAGLVIVNDWSARDFQRFEYQPLGPFLAKSFATSVSPWLVSLDALEPFRLAGMEQDPEPLPHLRGSTAFDIQLEVTLQTAQMTQPQVICSSNAKHLYWSFAQQIAHQSSNGTPLEPGDLYATGTISGTEEGTYGSMLELTWRGSMPLVMEETGERRAFLQAGDEVVLRAWAGEGEAQVSLGDVRTKVLS
ncbi:MAG: fumarylacetoacetase [Fimbriimonas sp.]